MMQGITVSMLMLCNDYTYELQVVGGPLPHVAAASDILIAKLAVHGQRGGGESCCCHGGGGAAAEAGHPGVLAVGHGLWLRCGRRASRRSRCAAQTLLGLQKLIVVT